MIAGHAHTFVASRSRPCTLPRAHRQHTVTAQALLKTTRSGKVTEKGTTTTKQGTKTVKSTTSTKGTVSSKQSVRGIKKAQSPPEAPKKTPGSRFYCNITGFPFPIGPSFTRNTIRYEVVKDTIWTFEQTQALELFNVYTPVRMTVIKLKSGGLWVHAPVAPTDECIKLLKELDAPVEYIVLPTFAYEHKVFVGPFSRKFPKAKVYVTPYQWSFPLNLPPQFFGIFPTGELKSGGEEAPWADEIDQKVFLPPSIGVSDFVRFSEVAFFHKATRTLMVTDAVVYVSEQPPDVIPTEALLETARDNFLAKFISGGLSREEVEEIAEPGKAEDTLANRIKGWKRMSLLVLYFNPNNLLLPDASFAAISNRLFVGPVVQTLVYSKVPNSIRQWVDEICSDWNFRQIIPCHFSAPIQAGPAEFKSAFAFAYPQEAEAEPEAEPSSPLPSWFPFKFGNGSTPKTSTPKEIKFPEEDMKALNTLNNALISSGAVYSNAEER